jgi:hypothetical protein
VVPKGDVASQPCAEHILSVGKVPVVGLHLSAQKTQTQVPLRFPNLKMEVTLEQTHGGEPGPRGGIFHRALTGLLLVGSAFNYKKELSVFPGGQSLR